MPKNKHKPQEPLLTFGSTSENTKKSSQRPGKTSKILLLTVFAFIALAIIAAGMAYFGMKVWKVLYVENDHLLLRHLVFPETAHYSAEPTHGRKSIATILSEGNIETDKTNLLKINLEDIRKLLNTQPLLGDFTIEKILPDTLRITAHELTPVARLIYTNQRTGSTIMPIALRKNDLQAEEDYQFVVLPSKLDLYNERTGTQEQWDYVLYPHPFDKQTVNNELPDLYNFSGFSGELTEGSVIKDKKLAAAVRLLNLTGPASQNMFFTVSRIDLLANNVLRAKVKPTANSTKVLRHAVFDFDCTLINSDVIQKVLAYLATLEKNPSSPAVQYLNAVSPDAIYSKATINVN